MNISNSTRTRWLVWLGGLLTLLSGGGTAFSAEPVTDAPLPPEEAAARMRVPDGFKVTLFAGEPHVRQPIGFCFDDRGRLWVAEAYSYPDHRNEGGRDRILIFEDSDKDGRFDKRTVFYEGLNYVTGIEVGFGGAWVMSPPWFLFIPDANGDDIPDGPPEVLLDGFGNHANSHNLANGFAWGPDGWLYGTHGRTNWSMVGPPGAPPDRRVRFDGGVYRYHPIEHVWEPVADGTTNPWGIDWNDVGEAFVCNCVNPHLFHVIPGAHYEPWRNRESSRYAYQRIDTIADHLHFVGTDNVRDGLGSEAEDAAGGGHAHSGTMIYLGDNWPEEYRDHVYMNNIHGKRINHDLLRPHKSGYIASHAPDVVRSTDPWFVGVNLTYGPDGAVYLSDWSDTGECHSVRNTRRETGRLFRISYSDPPPQEVDVASESTDRLVDLQTHRNDWWVRHARRNLQERYARGDDLSAAHQNLRTMFETSDSTSRRLRALWSLAVSGGATPPWLISLLDDNDEYVRGWAIRLLAEHFHARPRVHARAATTTTATHGNIRQAASPPSSQELLSRFEKLAASDPSPHVRLVLASTLQRLPPAHRWNIARRLAAHDEDADDPNLPLMIWYGIEPLVHEDATRFISLTGDVHIPQIVRFIARRVLDAGVLHGTEQLSARLIGESRPEFQLALLTGILEGAAGQRSIDQPPSWQAAFTRLQASGNPPVQEAAIQLALLFNDPAAIDLLLTRCNDRSLDEAQRNAAMQALIARRQAGFDTVLIALLDDSAVLACALRGLAEYDHPDTPDAILERYQQLDPEQRQDALQTLASRNSWASKLLDAIDRQLIPKRDVTAFTARQIVSLGDDQLTQRLEQAWGRVRESPADRLRQMESLKTRLTDSALANADPAAGRAVFEKQCATCHKLFGTGESIGPDLTGSQRMNLDYLLQNLVDPSASVARDYQMQVIVTDSGRVLTGLVLAETDQSLTLATVNEKVIVPRQEIESRTPSDVSMMPDGLLRQLSEVDLRNLIRYLQSPTQVPLPAHPDGQTP